MLSSRARLAMRTLLDLSVHYEEGLIPIEDVAHRQGIQLKYLQGILLGLKAEGFVQSRKGPGGGYGLARPPREISLASVVRATDGPIAPVGCVSVTRFEACGCPDPETCAIRRTFGVVRDAVASFLEATSFEDLRAADGTRAQAELMALLGDGLAYHI